MKKIGTLKLHPSAEIAASRVSVGFECLDRELFKPEKCYDLLGQSGVKHARCQTGWVRCEKEKGVYDFAWLDEIVDSLLARGVEPWFCVSFGNPLYMPDALTPAAVGCVPLLYGDEVIAAWKEYVRRMAEHYKDRVTHFEIWNEPNIKAFWFPGEPNGREYAQLVSMTGAVIRQEIPQAQIGGVISRYAVNQFTEDFCAAIAPDDIDFFCYHAYGLKPEENYLADIRSLRECFDRYGLGHVELWQGEAGCPSWFPPNHWLHPKFPGTERLQAVWMLRRFVTDLAAGAALSSYFIIADIMEKPYAKARDVLTNPARHGILNGLTYTPKKSYGIISRLSTLLAGEAYPVPRSISVSCPGAEEKPLAFAFSIQGKPVWVYYLVTDIEIESPQRWGCTVRLGQPGLKSPVLIDPYTGDCFEIEEKDILRRGDTAILSNLPIGEYPLFLCEKELYEIVPETDA